MTLDDLRGLQGFVYLATPYRLHPFGLSCAAYDARRHVGYLIREGFSVFSPIAHSHDVARACGLDPTDNDLWIKQFAPLMEAAAALVIAKIPSWDVSDGVAKEAAYFQAAGKPVVEMEPIP